MRETKLTVTIFL